jgi:molybdopterin-guanine dinucleotide biosynthesis protein A
MTIRKPESNKEAPVLNGLVLAGGRSKRMGRDKGLINWHGKEQQYYMADLLKVFCNEVFISCREEQRSLINAGYKIIPDRYENLGPYGAILSAFQNNAQCAWLVVACDLPLLDAETLSYLVERRDPKVMATTFKSPHDGLPEPLITIWEPKANNILLASLAKGYQCPRKALINNEIRIIEVKLPDALMNVNTPEEMEKAMSSRRSEHADYYDGDDWL